MKRKIINSMKHVFWKLPLSAATKEKLRLIYATRKDQAELDGDKIVLGSKMKESEYITQVLSIPTNKSEQYVEYEQHSIDQSSVDVIAYYLTQFHPNIQNDTWWGKGTTEWTNVSKAVPQYVSHFQPRLPGELGYYDLRLRENMERQIELAKNYGIRAFCYYYYWFDGERLLERPLDMFLEDKSLNMPFCICWANENWTKRFSGTNADILMKVNESTESCTRFIYDILEMISDSRYYTINNKPVIVIYRPSMISNSKDVINQWRNIVKTEMNKDLYIIAVQEKGDNRNWCKEGYDAETEFQPKRVNNVAKDITQVVQPLRADFKGTVYDYEDLIKTQKYKIKENMGKKVYPAVMPMWDNTARRNNNGLIYHGATPDLYKEWLKESIASVRANPATEQSTVFINAWNEWGEGAYLEPDRYWGYAYLQATYDALIESGE